MQEGGGMTPTPLLVAEARQLRPRFARLSGAIYQVLSNHRIQDEEERTLLFGEIMRVFNGQRKSGRKTSYAHARAAEGDPPKIPDFPSSDVTPQMVRDARARERDQRLVPADAWDSEAEEAVRKPLHPES